MALSILNAMPPYSIQTPLLAYSFCDDNEVMTRKLVWGFYRGSNKTHLISWDQVCQLKGTSGLGLKRLCLMNEDFMMKIR